MKDSLRHQPPEHGSSSDPDAPFVAADVSSWSAASGTTAEGADWSDAFAVTQSVVGLIIGDVCGHDWAARSAMLEVRAGLLVGAQREHDPLSLIRDANAAMCARTTGLYATAIVAMLDVAEHRLTFANAGHPPPFMIWKRGSHFLRRNRCDMPLGIAEPLDVQLHTVPLPPGALVVFYTDGVIERGSALHDAGRFQKAVQYAYHRDNVDAQGIAAQLRLETNCRDDASLLTVRLRRSP